MLVVCIVVVVNGVVVVDCSVVGMLVSCVVFVVTEVVVVGNAVVDAMVLCVVVVNVVVGGCTVVVVVVGCVVALVVVEGAKTKLTLMTNPEDSTESSDMKFMFAELLCISKGSGMLIPQRSMSLSVLGEEIDTKSLHSPFVIGSKK